MKRINKNLLYIFLLMGGDFFLFLISEIIERSYYIGPHGYLIAINLIFLLILIGTTGYLIYVKRVKPCVVGGFLYFILGLLLWLYKLVYYCAFLFSDTVSQYYEKDFDENSIYFVCFLINLITIFLRIGACYLIKKNFNEVKLLEVYIHEKEHAEFIQSLGTQDGDKLYEDEEVNEDKLYAQNKNNPFVTGRPKKDEDEEEICFQTTL